MKKEANKTLIGAFVVGAITLSFIAVLVFGSGKFLRSRQTYVLFFEGSVQGLQVGAPVLFRGVKIGEVVSIVLHFDPDGLSVLIPIYVEIDPAQFRPVNGLGSAADSQSRYAPALIQKGLKARLELQSLVTGLLAVGFDFYPDEPLRQVGLEKRYTEVPTLPSSAELFKRKLENLPLESIGERLDSLLAGLVEVVRSPELSGGLTAFHRALIHLDRLTLDLDARLKPLATSLTTTSSAARDAFAQAERTMALRDGVAAELASSAKDTLAAARTTLLDTQQAVAGVRRIAGDDSPVVYELNEFLENATAFSRSLRSLADYLDRHPEALINGKSASQEK